MENEAAGLRVALVTPVLWPYVPAGGINYYVAMLARELAKQGHAVTVVGREIHALAVATETAYAEPWGRSVSVVPSAPGGIAPGSFRNLRAAIAVGRYLRRHAAEFDVVETTNWLGHGAFCASAGVPTVARVSTPAMEYLAPSFGVRHVNWLEGRSCRRADRVVGHSQAILDTVRPMYGLRGGATTVIPLGVDDVAESGAGRSRAFVDVLCVGRAEHRKGTDVLLRSALEALGSEPSLRLTLLGADLAAYERTRPDLASAIRELRGTYGARFRDLGVVDDDRKTRAYAEAHYAVVPSRFESFGLVVPEAMRAGTPVIAAAGGALADVCAFGPANVVYGDPEAQDRLTAELRDAARRGPAEAESRRAATRSAYVRHFTPERFVERTIACYRETVAARRGPAPTNAFSATSRYRLAKE